MTHVARARRRPAARLLLLVLLSAAAAAGEPVAEPATRHLPADARVVVRFASLDRLDAVGRRLAPIVDARRPLSAAVLPRSTAELPIDRTRPAYCSLGERGVVWHFHAREGTVWPAPRKLIAWKDSAELRDGILHVADESARLDGPRRGEPLPMLDSDASVVVDAAALVAKYGPEMEKTLREIDKLDTRKFPVTRAVLHFGRALLALFLEGLRGVDTVHYGLTWSDGRLLSEGWLRTRPRSSLRAFLSRAKEAKPHDLAGYLPRRSFWTVDACGLGSWLDEEVAAFLDTSFGEGAGKDLLLLLAPSFALGEHLNGRGAGAIGVTGMMSFSMRSIWEVRPDAPIDAAIRAFDAARINRRLKELGLPATVRCELAVDTDGETKIHRVTYATAEPRAAMFAAQMQTCFAVEGGYLLTAQSMDAMNELRSLIARVRRGKPGRTPHLDAMQRLGPGRHEGLTVNLGAVKPLAGMAAWAVPGVLKIAQAFPDELYLSTALTVRNGHVHLRGDWPATELLGIVEKLR